MERSRRPSLGGVAFCIVALLSIAGLPRDACALPGTPTPPLSLTASPTATACALQEATLAIEFRAVPAAPSVGQSVMLEVRVRTTDFPAYAVSYDLYEESGGQHLAGDTSARYGMPLMSPLQPDTVTYQLTAVQAGTARLVLSVHYEVCEQSFCGNTCTFRGAGAYFDLLIAPEGPTPTPTPVVPSPTPTCFFPTPPALTIYFVVHPETPKVGDIIEVTASISTRAGPPTESGVYSTSPIIDNLHVTSGFGGSPVTFEMKAVEVGTVRVTLSISYEITVEICDPVYPIYQFVRASRDVDITVAPIQTPTPTPATCVGDCGEDGAVSVEEILVGVNILLGSRSVDACAAIDANHDAEVTVDEIVTAVGFALTSCASSSPTPTATATASPTPNDSAAVLVLYQIADALCWDRFRVVGTTVFCESQIGHYGNVSLVGYTTSALASAAFGTKTDREEESLWLGSVLRVDSRPWPCCDVDSLEAGRVQNWRWRNGCWIISGYAFDDTHFLWAPQPKTSVEIIVNAAAAYDLFSHCADGGGCGWISRRT